MTESPPALAGPPLLTRSGACAHITLQRPAQRHRLSAADLLVIQGHLAELTQDASVRVLVLRSSGPVFCAGYHLGEFTESLAAGAPGGPALFEQTVQALADLPIPTLCQLSGSVYGGATDLALACDFRLGVHSMHLRMPAARLGLHYYASGLQRAVGVLGLQGARRVFLLGAELGAHELLALGFLDICVPETELQGAVDAWVQALVAGAPLAVRGMKQSLTEIALGTGETGAPARREAASLASQDLREGLAAWTERRAPRFSGR